jgi:flagellar FliL protein
VPPRAKIDHTIPTQCYLIGVVNDDVTVKPATTVRNISRYTVGLALLVAIGSGSYYLFHGADPPVWYKKAVSSWSHKPVTAREMTGSQSPPLIRQLPASIRTAKPDPSFTASAPGWERYSSDTKEFRVFREQGAIRAIQVIALKGNILTDSFFKEFLREICREEPRAATQHSTENGYELENGALPCGAQFTTYRKHGNSSMIAFVVSLP